MYLPQSDDRVGNSSQIALDSLAQHSCLPAFGNASYLSPLPALLRCCKCRPWPKSPGPTKLAADWRTLVIRVSFDRTSASRRSEIEWCLQKSWRKEKRLDKKKKENTKREIFLYIRKRSAAHVLSITYRLKKIQKYCTSCPPWRRSLHVSTLPGWHATPPYKPRVTILSSTTPSWNGSQTPCRTQTSKFFERTRLPVGELPVPRQEP